MAPDTISWLGEGYLRAGRMDDAMQLAERALNLSRTHSERGNEAWTRRLLGEIASRHDSPDVEKAEEYHHQAISVADALGMCPLIAHCHVGRANCTGEKAMCVKPRNISLLRQQ